MEDLIQEGFLAILQAEKTYNPEKSKFTSYCYRPIFWSIHKYVTKDNKNRKLISKLKNLIIEYANNSR